MASTATAAVTLGEPGLFRAPHPVLHRLREADPVHFSEALGSWILLRYDDVSAALRDDRFAPTGMARRIESREDGELPALLRSVQRWVGRSSVEDHARVRRLLHGHFAARRTVAALQPQVRSLADALLAELVARGGGDIVGDLAYPLTAGATAQAIGLPASAGERLIDWAGRLRGVLQTGSDASTLLAAQEAADEAASYMREAVDRRRGAPGDDMIGVLLGGLESGLIRDREEIVANLVMMAAAGFDNTSNVISAGTWLLLAHPAQLARLRADPSLIPSALEEIARYQPPVFVLTRIARTDIVLRGKRIHAGDSVYICLAAANRDPRAFPHPDAFLIDRAENRHVAFGAGPYACLAARMGRMQARVAFEQLLERAPALTLAPGHEWYEFRPLGCWLSTLPVQC